MGNRYLQVWGKIEAICLQNESRTAFKLLQYISGWLRYIFTDFPRESKQTARILCHFQLSSSALSIMKNCDIVIKCVSVINHYFGLYNV